MRRPEVRALSRQLERRGERGWIVGGAPRDLILGRPVAEIDVAVRGDAEALATAMERMGFGRCVELSRSAPRVFRVAGSHEIDLAELGGSGIGEDLSRRDFTANAVAVEIPGGLLLDPFGGIGDVLSRRLRMIRGENLSDDPARVFRAARLIATHGLSPDSRTSRACREAAPGLSRVAPERLRVELAKLLEASRAVPALTWAARIGGLAPALGVDPTDARRLTRSLSALDRPALRRLLPADRFRLRLAILAAGLGFSPSETSRWLLSRRFSREQAGGIATLLDLVERAGRATSDRTRWEWVRDAGPNAADALILLRLLRPEQRAAARGLERRVQRARQAPRVRGSEVVSWLGIPPGPRVGTLLRDLEVEMLRGTIRTRGQARHWLKGRVLQQ